MKLNRLAVVLAAMPFASTLTLFGPAQIYLTNSLEFKYRFSELLPLLAVGFLSFAFVLSVLLLILPSRVRERVTALLLAVGFLLWLQGYLLVWNYGLLNGHNIQWGSKFIFGLIDTPIWLLGILLALIKPVFFSRQSKVLVVGLLLVQLFSCTFYLWRQPPLPSFKKFQPDETNLSNFSADKNVIILVLDSFQSDIFQEIIDQDPSYRRIFDNFVYYRNTCGGFPSTYAAIPFLLTTRRYDNTVPLQSFLKDAYLSPTSMPRVMKENGFNVDLFPAVPKSIFYDPRTLSNLAERPTRLRLVDIGGLYDLTLFRHLPHFLKRYIYNNEEWLLGRWLRDETLVLVGGRRDGTTREERQSKLRASNAKRRMRADQFGVPANLLTRDVAPDLRFLGKFVENATVSLDRPSFKFYHLRGTHEPIQMDSRLWRVNLPLTRTNVVDLGKGELTIVNYILNILKTIGVYDNSLIVIMADHGQPWGAVGLQLPKDLSASPALKKDLPDGVPEAGIPLLLIKRIGGGGELSISDAPVSVGDLVPTIFTEMNLPLPAGTVSVFQVRSGDSRRRFFYYYNWSNYGWKSEYLPEIVEYEINGHSWLPASWKPTGRILPPRN